MKAKPIQVMKQKHRFFDVTIQIINEKGEVEKSVKAKSWVYNIINEIYVTGQGMTGGASSHNFKDITGTTYNNWRAYSSEIASLGLAGVTNKGIVVGTSTQAVAGDDYALIAQIGHGSGVGELNYGSESAVAPSTLGSTRSFQLTRTFTNSSGAVIEVKEVGIYVLMHRGTPSVTDTYCIADRTLLAFSINNGQAKTVQYTISITV